MLFSHYIVLAADGAVVVLAAAAVDSFSVSTNLLFLSVSMYVFYVRVHNCNSRHFDSPNMNGKNWLAHKQCLSTASMYIPKPKNRTHFILSISFIIFHFACSCNWLIVDFFFFFSRCCCVLYFSPFSDDLVMHVHVHEFCVSVLYFVRFA